MRVSREKAAENRERIVAAASRLFREQGFDGVGLDAIMEEAGLTHGGFYRHFGSKDDLAAEAVARGLAASAQRQEALDSLPALVAGYLSPRHRDDRGGGCVMAALAGDIARQSPGVRRRLTASLRVFIDRIAGWIGGRPAAAREHALVTVAGLVGAVVLARAVDDAALSDEILVAARKAYGGRAQRR